MTDKKPTSRQSKRFVGQGFSREGFSRVWAAGVLILIVVTYPLWLPLPFRVGEYPAVESIGLPELLRGVSDIIAAGVVILSLTLSIAGVARRSAWILATLGLIVMVINDQHRLQPWCYQSIAYGLLFSLFRWREARLWITLITASIYIYSAAGKLDYQFVHTVGHQMVSQALGLVMAEPGEYAARIAIGLPIVELLLGLLILIPMTRKYGGIVAIALHVALIVLLGPWSLGHSLGVLSWNALLAIQSWMLFVGARDVVAVESLTNAGVITKGLRGSRWVVRALLLVMLAAPTTERLGYWDHWTSWSLYSPHTSRAIIQVHDSAMDKLPERVREFFDEDDDGDRWRRLQIERWSISDQLVPVYPQARYQLSLADRLAHRYELGAAIRVELRSTSDRFSGKRTSKFLIGDREIKQESKRFWLPIGR